MDKCLYSMSKINAAKHRALVFNLNSEVVISSVTELPTSLYTLMHACFILYVLSTVDIFRYFYK